NEQDSPTASFLRVSASEIQFNAQSDFECDAIKFQTADRGQQTTNRDEVVRRLSSAVSHYRGDFLEGLRLADAPLLEALLLVEREQLRATALELLDTLIQEHKNRQEQDEVIALAQRQIEIEPWHESAYKNIMRALSQKGDRNGALTQYARLSDLLAKELGVE